MAKPLPRGAAPLHPGEYLRLTVLPRLLQQGVAKGAFAERLGVSGEALDNLIGGKTNMTPSMALRLGRLLGDPPERWMALQAAYDLWKAEAAMAETLKGLQPLPTAKAKKKPD
jgi:addiction module HigA family antidote